MPEGDVVLRTARRLHSALAGRALVRSDLRWPSLATVDLHDRHVLEVVAAGKHLLMRLDGGLTLHSHLRMEGSWHVHRTGEPWRSRRPEHEIRAVLANQQWTAVGHRLGMLDLVGTDQEARLVGHLGPDVLGPGWDPVEAARRLGAEPARPVADALLDQRVLAGVGTFYTSETCFLRGVTPWTPVRDVPDHRAVVDLVHRIMTANVDRVGQVTTGNARPGQEQWVHGRAGRPCRRCGTTIRISSVGAAPKERVAFWCPRCQRGPAPTGTARPLGSGPRQGRRPADWAE